MTKVAILLPTTGRAKQMTERVSDLAGQAPPAGVDVHIYLAIPKDDEKSLDAADELAKARPEIQEHGSALVQVYTPVHIVLRPSGSTAVEGWNAAHVRSLLDNPDWLVLGADDIVWRPGWLGAALASAAAGGAQVVGLNDGHTNLHHYGAHYMVKRAFVEEQQGGCFIPPHYQSWWFDREVCEKADHLGLYVACWDAMAEHLHPEWQTAEMDETYERGYALHEADRLMYEARKAAGWPVDYEPIAALKGASSDPVVADPDPTPEISPPAPRKKPAKKKSAAKGAKKS